MTTVTPVPTDIAIAQAATLRPITDVAAEAGLGPDDILPYGRFKAKVTAAAAAARPPKGKLVLVTGISPTPAGEGKSTVLVGLGMALQVLPIPDPPFGAPVALSTFRLTVGGAGLRYVRSAHGLRTLYRPRAIPLPRSCPAGGFRFRAIVRFADGQRLVEDARAACPARSVPGGSGS